MSKRFKKENPKRIEELEKGLLSIAHAANETSRVLASTINSLQGVIRLLQKLKEKGILTDEECHAITKDVARPVDQTNQIQPEAGSGPDNQRGGGSDVLQQRRDSGNSPVAS